MAPLLCGEAVHQGGGQRVRVVGEVVDHAGQGRRQGAVAHAPTVATGVLSVGEGGQEDGGGQVRPVRAVLGEEFDDAIGVPARSDPDDSSGLRRGRVPAEPDAGAAQRVGEQHVQPGGHGPRGDEPGGGRGAVHGVQEPAQARPLRRARRTAAVQGTAQLQDRPALAAGGVPDDPEPPQPRHPGIVHPGTRAGGSQALIRFLPEGGDFAEHLRVGAVDDVVDRAIVQGPVHRPERQQRPVDQISD